MSTAYTSNSNPEIEQRLSFHTTGEYVLDPVRSADRLIDADRVIIRFVRSRAFRIPPHLRFGPLVRTICVMPDALLDELEPHVLDIVRVLSIACDALLTRAVPLSLILPVSFEGRWNEFLRTAPASPADREQRARYLTCTFANLTIAEAVAAPH